MIGVDTNVLVRATVRDDADQAQRADAFLDTLTREKPGYVTHIVLVELWWVLTRVYKYAPRQALDVIETILDAEALVTQDAELVADAASAVSERRADFADALIVAISKRDKCTMVRTFDTKAVKHAGMTAIK